MLVLGHCLRKRGALAEARQVRACVCMCVCVWLCMCVRVRVRRGRGPLLEQEERTGGCTPGLCGTLCVRVKGEG